MQTLPKFALIATGLLALAGAAAAQQRHGPLPVETATIENSGSTNTTGYTIAVSSAGTASVGGAAMQPLPKAVASKFFADLKAAGSLASLPAGHGMHSASFGTRTWLTYRGQRSPDLTFPGDSRGAALKSDILSITEALHVRSLPRRPMPTPPPPTH
jgi:hypothetical protein